MSSQFSFSPDQIGDLARLLGDRKYIPDFELMVHEFREASNKGMSVRRVSEHINGIARSSRKLRESIEALQRECGKDANWILEPLELCEHYSRALFEYQYSAPLPSGRPREGAKSALIKSAASYWRHVLNREPTSRGGEFPDLIQLLLVYSEVPGALIENLEELIEHAMPNYVVVQVSGPDYPFVRDIDERISLPQPRRAAEGFFSAFVLSPQDPAWPKRPNRAAKKQTRKKK